MLIPTINMKATGENIEKLHKQCGLSVRDLQSIFNFGTPMAIYKWQWGKTLPTLDNLVVLAAIFGVSIDEIIITNSEESLRIGA